MLHTHHCQACSLQCSPLHNLWSLMQPTPHCPLFITHGPRCIPRMHMCRIRIIAHLHGMHPWNRLALAPSYTVENTGHTSTPSFGQMKDTQWTHPQHVHVTTRLKALNLGQWVTNRRFCHIYTNNTWNCALIDHSSAQVKCLQSPITWELWTMCQLFVVHSSKWCKLLSFNLGRCCHES